MDTTHDLTSVEAVRAFYGEPSQLVQTKKGSRVSGEVVEYLERAPFFVLSTADTDGRCDASPRGGPPGMIRVLDDSTIMFPDLGGNRLVDSIMNIVKNPNMGMLVMIPSEDETLRVDGRARLTQDPELIDQWSGVLNGVRLAVVVSIDNVFIHCAKAFRRSALWDPSTWDQHDGVPDATGLYNAITEQDLDPEEMRQMLEAGYQAALKEEQV